MSNMKELYYNLQTAFMDCIEYEGKSLTEWDELCKVADEEKKRIELKKKMRENAKKT